MNDPNSNKRQTEKTKIEMEKEKQEKNDGKRERGRMLVCRRWTGRWPRHWFLLVFIDHVPSLLGRLCPLTEILAWDEGGGWNRRRAPHLIFHIEDSMDFLPYLQSSRKDYLRISIRPLLLQHGVRLSDGPAKNIGEIWLENRRKLLYIRDILSKRIVRLFMSPRGNKFSFKIWNFHKLKKWNV